MNSGRLFCFASGGGSSRIQYGGAKLVQSDAPAAKAAANRRYHVIAQIQPAGVAEKYVDDRLVLTTHLDIPPGTLAQPGLWRWNERNFENVRVYTGDGR